MARYNSKQQAKSPFRRWRYVGVLFLLFICMCALLWRMVYLTIFNRPFLKKQGDARIIRTIELPAYRGMITDRNGEPLAISTPIDSVWIDPQIFTSSPEQVQQLAEKLSLAPYEILKKVAENSTREFAYLKRGINPEISNQIKNLDIRGVYLQREFRRFYPEGEVMAHVLGFTNIDDRGQEGIELAYEPWLRGQPGLNKVMKDRLGRVIAEIKQIRAPQPGKDIQLSIDKHVQYLAYHELKNAVQLSKAKSGSIVIMDIGTGEVLAMVNQPSYNPNLRAHFADGRYRNRAVTDVFEPGSTIKPLSVVNALSSGKYNKNSLIDTSPGWMVLNGETVREWDRINKGVIDIPTILKRSSNVGIAKLTLSLDNQSLWQTLDKFGFGKSTNSGFPGEVSGVLVKRRYWSDFVLATLSFGYGLSATPLQLAHAYTVIANRGILPPVSLLKVEGPTSGERIIEANVADEVLEMLRTVVEDNGTAANAQINGYHVGGKTGTVQIAGAKGYNDQHHTAIFVGIAPITRPKLVMVVVVHDPQGKSFYGGSISAPIFAKVMGGALRLLNILPDNLSI